MRLLLNAINKYHLMLRSDPARPGRVSKHAPYSVRRILAQPLRECRDICRPYYRQSPERLRKICHQTFKSLRVSPCAAGRWAYLSGSRRTRTCLWPMVVMQRRNASFLAARPSKSPWGRSREGGRYGCFPIRGRRGALPWRQPSRDASARAG